MFTRTLKGVYSSVSARFFSTQSQTIAPKQPFFIVNNTTATTFTKPTVYCSALTPAPTSAPSIVNPLSTPSPLSLPSNTLPSVTMLFKSLPTYRPSVIRRKRKHGFLKRTRTKDGVNLLKRRRAKNRKYLSA